MKFVSPRAKLGRALELRDGLAKLVSSTLEPVENRPTIALRFDADSSECVLYVDQVPDLGSFFVTIGLQIGDVVHNFRSALDHLIYQLALNHQAGIVKQPDKTQFPIADDPKDFEAAKKRYLLEVAPTAIVLIEQFQPYHPMEENVSIGLYFHPLAMLRDLSNADKHRLLTPVLIPSTGLSFDGPAQWLALMSFTMASFLKAFSGQAVTAHAMAPGLELARLPVSGVGQSEGATPVGHTLPVVAFADGHPVVALLDKIGRAVGHIIESFEKAV